MKIIEVTILKAGGGKVVARADVHFEGFLLKGFKVIQDPSTHKEYVTPPSYLAGGRFWRPLFKTDNEADWKEIQQQILNQYNTQQIQEVVDES